MRGRLASSVCTWHKLIGKLWLCLLLHTNGPTLVPRQFMFQYETKVDQGMSLVNWELIICQIGVWISHNSYCLWVVEHREVWLETLTESVSVNGACLQSVVSLLKCGSTTFSRKWGDTHDADITCAQMFARVLCCQSSKCLAANQCTFRYSTELSAWFL